MAISTSLSHNQRNKTCLQLTPSDLTLWNTDIPESDRLVIVNGDDFPLQQFLKNLGIDRSPLVDSFGITDETEIRHRHALTGLLVRHPAIAAWLANRPIPFVFPATEEQFLDFFDARRGTTSYWRSIKEFLSLVDQTGEKLPERLELLVTTLRSSLELETQEWKMGQDIAEKIEDVTELEGIATATTYLKSVQDHSGLRVTIKDVRVHGHQKFSSSLNDSRQKERPSWLTKKFR